MGTFGYVYGRKTKYACRDSGGAKSNYGNQTTDGQAEGVTKSDNDNLGMGWRPTTMDSDEALGGDDQILVMGTGSRLEISGMEYRRAGSKGSESNADECIQKD